MSRLVSSVVYLVGFTVVGYVLMKITEPNKDSQKYKDQIASYEHLNDSARTKVLIVQRLREASGLDTSDKK